MSAKIKVASICPRMALCDVGQNLHSVERWSIWAAEAKADLVLFPEAFVSGYVSPFMVEAGYVDRRSFLDLAEQIPGPSTARLCELSRRLNIFICAGIREVHRGRRYNTQVVISPSQGYLGKYRKVHVSPSESWCFEPGKEFPVFEIRGVPTGIMICRDKSYPETARILALRGAQLLLAPHSTTDVRDRRFTDWSLALCRARAMENGCYLIADNCIYDCEMRKGHLQGGYSFALDPYGKVIHCDRGRGDREKMALVTVDTKVVRERRDWEGKNFNLMARFPGTYRKLVQTA